MLVLPFHQLKTVTQASDMKTVKIEAQHELTN